MQPLSTAARNLQHHIGTATVVAAALLSPTANSADLAPFVRDGVAGFAVSQFKYALGATPFDAALCPDGMSLQVAEIFAMTAAGKRRAGESDADYGKRVEEGGKQLGRGPNGEDYCLNPETAPADPYFKTLQSTTVTALGIDLDAPRDSGAKPAACAHAEFNGPAGERGIDNQFYRLIGCSRSFLPEGQSNGFDVEMLSGSWGILINLAGVDDLRNDDDIEVQISAAADPLMLSPTRVPLAYATYAVDQDPHYRATTRGRLRDGVLTTDPVDVHFHHVVNSMRLQRDLRDARLQLTLSADGELKGYLAGYTPVESMYDLQYGYRNGRDGKGELSFLRTHSAHGAARVLGHTCPGAYQALHRLADGHPDPDSGACTSISTQYAITAVPAFVVDVATRSQNAELDKAQELKDAY